ncbi:hypothetical protein [Sporolactobacillus terrae]|uniref:hypothetical protein n=1 Tax=Sporolactobacillus terrae TaxID=269673 RepID=UPI00048F6717|nr:hypothetical protein [Sporolactobacillus terrae]
MEAFMIFLLIVATALGIWSQKHIQNKLVTELFKYKANNETKKYVNLLNSPLCHLFFSKKSRSILLVEYYLSYENYEGIKSSIKELINLEVESKNSFVELMKVYVYFLDNGHKKDAIMLENHLLSKFDDQRHVEFLKEISVLHGIYINHDPGLIGVLKKQLTKVQDFQEKSVILYRLTKLHELLNHKAEANHYMNELRDLANNNVKLQKF